MKCVVRIALASLCLCVGVAAIAAPDPVSVLKAQSDRILHELSEQKATLRSHPAVVETIIRRELLPMIDRPAMARAVVGPIAWRAASKAERVTFIKEFTTLVIHTYASAMANYSNETIKFFPVRAAKGSRVEVKSLILRKEGPSIPVSYRLLLSGDKWRVYDFSVDGISLVQSYQAQFSPHLSKGGLAALNQRLASHNTGRAKL